MAFSAIAAFFFASPSVRKTSTSVGMQRIVLASLWVFFAGSSPLFAAEEVQAPKFIGEIAQALEKLVASPAPWKSVENKGLRFGAYDTELKPANLFLWGYSEQELKKSAVEASPAKGANGLFSVKNPKPFLEAKTENLVDGAKSEVKSEGGLFLQPKGWAREFPDGSRLPLLDDTALPLFAVDVSVLRNVPSEHFKKLGQSAPFLAGIMAHELFHIYQHKLFDAHHEEASQRDLDECEKIDAWKKDVQAEFEDWSLAQKELAQKDTAPLKKILGRIVERRSAAVGKDQKACWSKVAVMEVVEGTAVYFSTQLGKAAKLNDAADVLLLYPKHRLHTDDKELFEGGSEFYYVTGAYLCEALAKLDPTLAWQKAIESGQTLLEVVKKQL